MSLTPENIRKMAEAYTEAWCTRSGEMVASFFSKDATSIINKAEPTIGRSAIAEAMGAFFVEFPDLSFTHGRSTHGRKPGNLFLDA